MRRNGINRFGLPLMGMALCLPLATPMPAFARSALPDRFELGRDSNGEPCAASRDWSRTDGVVKTEAEQAFLLTCRGVSSARLQGIVMPASSGIAQADARKCGTAAPLSVPGLTIEAARQCFDPALGMQVVELRTTGRVPLIGAATPGAMTPLIALMRARSEGGVMDIGTAPAAIDISVLPAAPPVDADRRADASISAETALQQGVQLMQSGQHAEASRILNDALSRTDDRTSAPTVIELMMSAALADSGLRQFEVADEGFTGAAILLSANLSSDRAAYLEDALRTYRALDALNRRQWEDALAILDARPNDGFPLRDPVALSMLNRAGERAGQTSLSLRDKGQLYWLILDIQQRYAKSVALLALKRFAESRHALEGSDGAASRFAALEGLAQPSSINWLRSRIQLQRARIDARDGKVEPALAGFDCAIGSMRGLPQQDDCIVPLKAFALSAAASDAAVADVQLERAAVAMEGPNSDAAQVEAGFAQAVDTLVSAGDSSRGTQQPTLASYLRLLLKRGGSDPADDVAGSFFRAMQVVGDPAIATDMARLANVVASDSAVGAKIRDKDELERRVRGLGYQIAAIGATDDAQGRERLEQERSAALAELDAVNAALAGETKYLAQDDSPVTIADIRGILRPREVYLKLVEVGGAMFGIAIDSDKVQIYETVVPAGDISRLSAIVLETARSHLVPTGKRIDCNNINPAAIAQLEKEAQQNGGSLQLCAFEVQASHALFRAMTGPAYEMVSAAPSLVFDPAGPLRTLPVGILVTDAASVLQYKQNRSRDSFDYSGVSFLATRTDLAMALSPRSFHLVRSRVPQSTAAKPFLGFGENAPSPEVGAALASRPVLRGRSCAISYADWARVKNGSVPISSNELRLAATALGAPDSPMITGADFTDTAIMNASRDGQLNQYQVLHFATHGLPQTSVEIDGCQAELQPSLVATMAAPSETGGEDTDGLLSFGKVADLDLNANLVVLSACETAASASAIANRAVGAEGATGALDGLIRAFITAKARSVLATYWRVPATTDSENLMTAFYTTGRTGTIGEALRVAQTSLIKRPQSSHPYYWGAYFVVGDTAKTMLTGARSAGRAAGASAGM